MRTEIESPGAAATATGARVVEVGTATTPDNCDPDDGQIALSRNAYDRGGLLKSAQVFFE